MAAQVVASTTVAIAVIAQAEADLVAIGVNMVAANPVAAIPATPAATEIRKVTVSPQPLFIMYKGS